jgi:AcrR family transcriptional regulator
VTVRQREIADAARAVLDREGLEALTVGTVAREVGVKPPSLYKHFAGKREIEAVLVADGFAALAAALEAAGPDLDALGGAYRAFGLEHPQLYRLMTERPLPRDLLPPGLEDRAAAPLLGAVADADAARALWAFAHGMVALELAGRFPPEADLDAAWNAGLKAFGIGPS